MIIDYNGELNSILSNISINDLIFLLNNQNKPFIVTIPNNITTYHLYTILSVWIIVNWHQSTKNPVILSPNLSFSIFDNGQLCKYMFIKTITISTTPTHLLCVNQSSVNKLLITSHFG